MILSYALRLWYLIIIISEKYHYLNLIIRLYFYEVQTSNLWQATYIRSGFSATIKNENVCTCHKFQVIRVCSKSNNLYIFSLYCNHDLEDSIYNCLLSSMMDIQKLDKKSSFIFVGNLNAHH